ncbi:MAG: hypothetical protein RPS47_11100 [Colwellia sp.]|jgi:hypothetical protein
MKIVPLNCIIAITLLTCTGCVSSSINDSLALIEQEDNLANNSTANKNVLTSIQALRSSQKTTKKSFTQSHTFAYDLNNKELNYDDKIKIVSLVVNKNKTFIINIAPAKGKNSLEQLALSMARAEVLRSYISHFNNRVTIKFAPKLSTDTINLVTGA